MKTSVLEIGDIETVSIIIGSFPDGISKAFGTLEGKLDSLKGRKFYGAFTVDASGKMIQYRACLAVLNPDEADELGCELYLIPGGRYAIAKLKDWEDNIDKIGPAFEEMSKGVNIDISRPHLEYYKSSKELIIMSPIK